LSVAIEPIVLNVVMLSAVLLHGQALGTLPERLITVNQHKVGHVLQKNKKKTALKMPQTYGKRKSP
jgi:hypothetical protein